MKNTELRDICRKAKDDRGYSTQDLADMTGISRSTIDNFFATASKAPNVYNAGLLCKALGVSLDDYFGIASEESAEAQLRRQLAEDRMSSENQRLTEVNGLQKELDKSRLSTIFVLSFLCAVLSVALIFYIIVDFRIKDAGLIQGGEVGIGAWIIITLVAVAFGVMTSVLLSALRYGKRFAPEEQGRGEV